MKIQEVTIEGYQSHTNSTFMIAVFPASDGPVMTVSPGERRKGFTQR